MTDIATQAPEPVDPTTRERTEGRLGRWLARAPGALLLRMIGEAPHVIDGRTLDPHVQFILAAQRRKKRVGLCEPTPDAGRIRYRREVGAATGTPTPVGSVRELTIEGAAGELPARLYTPHGHTDIRTPLLVFLHGGGFVIGDLDTHDEPCRILCRVGGLRVLSVAYRLAPEHPFPCAVDDSIAAVRWAQAHAESLGADARRVCVGGDSAGGNLATVASLALAREGRAPCAQLLLYPVTDDDPDAPSRQLFKRGYVLEMRDVMAFSAAYLGGTGTDGSDPRVSPRRDADLAQSPPALVVVGGFDVLRDEGIAYANALRDAGVRVHARCEDGLVHGFIHLTTVSPGARRALTDIAREFSVFLSSV